MNGQYPASGEGGYMTAWFNFMSGNRYWELEPYFDLDGGRALALDGVEYIVYIVKAGPVEVTVKNHSYDVAWIDSATGERTKTKGFKGEHFVGEPVSKAHDWVLHISREGHKESMLKSYKFDSRGDEDSRSRAHPASGDRNQPSQDSLGRDRAAGGGPVAQASTALHAKGEARHPSHALAAGGMDRQASPRWRRLSRGGRGPRGPL